MATKIGHQNGEIGGFVELYAQVEDVRPIGPILMKQDHGGPILDTPQKPSSRGTAVAVWPVLISYLRGTSTQPSVFVRSDKVSRLDRPRSAVHEPH